MNRVLSQSVTQAGSELLQQAEALLSGQRDRVANAANLSSLLFHALKDVNWVGFYFSRGDHLIVGPFQGKPACVSLPMGKGVCGTSAVTRNVQRVADVHEFDGHISCDVDSRSELVLPLVLNDEVVGVLDLDSPVPNRFSAMDEELLLRVTEIYVRSID